VGHSDYAATKDAPAISMQLSHEALKAYLNAHVLMRGEMPTSVTRLFASGSSSALDTR
jgi:hypothetical protein